MNEKIFLGKRRDRAIATILSFKERECDNYLPVEVSTALRKLLLDEINDLCELAFDLIENDSVVINEEFMTRFEELYDKVLEMSE
jgi:spore coat polysaccharide biosynthesis predicted glycosyltransferase SpsG